MWGSALAIKWGAAKKAVTLNDGLGQGNNIAVFPTYVQGICAQLDLWRTSKNYRNKRFADAIAIWSGGNYVQSYINFCKARVPGLTENTIMNDAFWKSSMGIAFLKAQAWHEAGKQYPASDSDWTEAQKRVFSGVPTANTMKKAAGSVASVVPTAAAAHASGISLPVAIGIAAAIALVGFLVWKFKPHEATPDTPHLDLVTPTVEQPK
ncbi:hypothetical protein CO675_26965 [Bradyrhizobium sp. C9]|nr:hypothetical protein CO675_26965 [Bradyrhizobium sp. C9]